MLEMDHDVIEERTFPRSGKISNCLKDFIRKFSYRATVGNFTWSEATILVTVDGRITTLETIVQAYGPFIKGKLPSAGVIST